MSIEEDNEKNNETDNRIDISSFFKNTIELSVYPIILWHYTSLNKRRKLQCIKFNKKVADIFHFDDIANKYVKDIFKNFKKKKDILPYSKCHKTKKTVKRTFMFDDISINTKIIFVSKNYLYEVFYYTDTINNIDIFLTDPFNMVVIINKGKIYGANDPFIEFSKYNKDKLIDNTVQKIFVEKINYKNNTVVKNTILCNDHQHYDVELYIKTVKYMSKKYHIITVKNLINTKDCLIKTKIVNNIQIPFCVFDGDNLAETNMIYSNQIFDQLFKIEEKSKLIDIFDTNLYTKIDKNYSYILSPPVFIVNDYVFINHHYDLYFFHIENNMFGIIFTDITNNALENNKFMLIILTKIKKSINRILNITNLLTETELDYSKKEYVNTINEYNYSLLSLNNDFTDYLNIKNGKINLELESFNLRQEIDRYYDKLSCEASKKNINIDFKINPNIPPFIISDKNKIKQILLNLLNNAIEFTNKGSINLTVKGKLLSTSNSSSDESENKRDSVNRDSYSVNRGSNIYNNNAKYKLTFCISDTGIGISQDILDKIFEPFYKYNSNNKSYTDLRSDSSGRSNKIDNGSGLGLTLCRHLVQYMGGKIWISSKKNKGTKVYFDVIVEEYKNIDRIEEDSIKILNGKKVLIINDNN